jgi:beta-lactamase superfamily II metal-dependent hydrolase
MKKIFLVAMILLAFLTYSQFDSLDNTDIIVSNSVHKSAESTKTPSLSSSQNMEIHVIDVGQGDAILIEYDDTAMLIDAGDAKYGSTVTDYLQNEGIDDLDYVIGTHPHVDHIGGFKTILTTYPIDMYIDNGESYSSKTYSTVMSMVNSQNINYDIANEGDIYTLSPDISVQVLSSGDTDDTNEASVVLKATYNDVDILLMGDAGKDTELELLSENPTTLQNIEIIKIGHHGSYSASSESFLEYTDPETAIISVGKNNNYGHPHDITLNTLQNLGILTYRTDQNGTITISTNGSTYNIITKNQ